MAMTSLARLIEKRAEGIAEWLDDARPEIRSEQLHLEDGTVERAYWHYGYMTALRDVLALKARAALADK